MKGSKKKKVYFKKKKHPTPLINFVSLHSQKKKRVLKCKDVTISCGDILT